MGLTKGQKIKVLTLTEKAMIIEELKKGKRAADCAKKYKVSKATITNIKHKEKQIMVKVSLTYAGAGKMRTMKKAENPKTEKLEDTLPPKALLVIDNAPCHLELKTENGDIITIFLPPNATCLIQPMDQNAIRILKMHYKASLLAAIVAERNRNLLDTLKKINLRDAVTFLANSWEKVKPEVLKKCWKNLIGTNDQFCSEDDIPLATLRAEQICNEDPPLIRLLSEIDNQNYNQGDVKTWIRDESISDCETIASDSEVNDNENEMNEISDQNAVDVFNKAISWANSKNHPYSEIIILQRMREEALTAHLGHVKQTSIKKKFQ